MILASLYACTQISAADRIDTAPGARPARGAYRLRLLPVSPVSCGSDSSAASSVASAGIKGWERVGKVLQSTRLSRRDSCVYAYTFQ